MTDNESALVVAATAAFYHCDRASDNNYIVYIKHELQNIGMLEVIGGDEALSELLDGVFTRDPYEQYAPRKRAEVQLAAFLRRLSINQLHPSVVAALFYCGVTKRDTIAIVKKETTH